MFQSILLLHAKERKLLNAICQFLWVYSLDSDLGVTTTDFQMVRVFLLQLGLGLGLGLGLLFTGLQRLKTGK